jgi:GNAT superfamily N-acetyltransferase
VTSYDISDATPDELDFVLHSSKWSLRHSAEYRKMPTAAAFAVLNPLLNDLVARSAVLVARSGRRIFGWLAFEVVEDTFVLGYVYVRQEYRRRGVARQLLLAALESCPVTDLAYIVPTKRFADVAERYDLVFQEAT